MQTVTASSYNTARNILGVDFITPEEIMKSRRCLAYTPEQLAMFSNTLPPPETLAWCHDNNYMLTTGPNQPLSLLFVQSLKCSHPNNTHTTKSDQDDLVRPGWIMFRKEPVPNSFNLNWSEQEALLSIFETVPNAAEVVWCITTYMAVRGIRLFTDTYVRTASTDPKQDTRLYAGIFCCVGGLDIEYCKDELCHDALGLSAIRIPV